jgi:hypothetical protein
MIKIKSAWLITWECGNDSAEVIDKVITIINHRKGKDFVLNLVEVLYSISNSNLKEIGICAKDKAHNPYKSKYDFNGNITCGANPFIMARKVKNIEITTNSQDKEVISWTSYTQYRCDESSNIIKIREEINQVYTRIKTGRLSFEPLWNMEKGRFKTFEEI